MPHHWRPLAHDPNSIFKCKKTYNHDPWGPEKYNYTMMKYEATFYRGHTGITRLKQNSFEYLILPTRIWVIKFGTNNQAKI